MVEVGGSNPPGPTNKKPRFGGVFYWFARLDEVADAVRPNASWRAFSTERGRREARRVKTALSCFE